MKLKIAEFNWSKIISNNGTVCYLDEDKYVHRVTRFYTNIIFTFAR